MTVTGICGAGAGTEMMLVCIDVTPETISTVWLAEVTIMGVAVTLGQSVMVDGTAVMIAGFSGMLAAQMPVK
jgi:hypothetical protein